MPVVRPAPPWWGEPLGTDWLFVPGSPAPGVLSEIDVLHEGTGGMLRVVSGDEHPLLAAQGAAGVVMSPGTAGLTVHGPGPLALDVVWGGILRQVVTAGSVDAGRRLRWDPWAHALVLETAAPFPLVALALGGAGAAARLVVDEEDWRLDMERTQTVAGSVRVRLEVDGVAHVACHADPDGATAALAGLRSGVPRPGGAGGEAFAAGGPRAAANAAFARLGTLGRALDTGRWHVVVSRSPRHGTPAVFRARDWFRWSLPALARADPPGARAGIAAACRLVADAPGADALDVAGRSVGGGFALEQCADVPLGIEAYTAATGDKAVWSHPDVQDALVAVAEEFPRWYDAERGLFRTEVDASGTPPPGPFLAVPNAMVAAAYDVLTRRGVVPPAGTVRALRNCWGQAFLSQGWVAGAVTAEGEALFWNTPAAGIAALPRLGALAAHDPAWLASMGHLASREYPGCVPGTFPGEGLPGRGLPLLCAALDRLVALAPEHPVRLAASVVVAEAPLDGDGLACEAYDPESGAAREGAAAASLAGYLAVALQDGHLPSPGGLKA